MRTLKCFKVTYNYCLLRSAGLARTLQCRDALVTNRPGIVSKDRGVDLPARSPDVAKLLSRPTI
jgi:hypothetical protein